VAHYLVPACTSLLTRVQVNKHNENFVAAQSKEGNSAEDASKWTLAQLAKHMKSQVRPAGLRGAVAAGNLSAGRQTCASL
jgi:hypothetical protein